jgi:hypothetical protein
MDAAVAPHLRQATASLHQQGHRSVASGAPALCWSPICWCTINSAFVQCAIWAGVASAWATTPNSDNDVVRRAEIDAAILEDEGWQAVTT